MSDASPQVTVIVRTKNEEQAVGRCLELIYEQLGVSFEVVIVDSGSTDSTLEIVRKFPCRVVRISPQEFTYGRALNEGVRVSQAQFCVALSAHAYPFDRHWLRNMIAPFADERVAGVVGKTVPLPGANPFDRRGMRRRYHTTVFEVRDEDALGYSNANAAWRRSVWDEIPFDEELSGSEDVLWAREVRAAGLKVIYRPDACVYHSHNESPRELYNRFHRETLPRCLFGAEVRLFAMHRLLIDAVVGTGWDWFYLLFVTGVYQRRGLRGQLRALLYAPLRRLAINYGRYRGSREAGYPNVFGFWKHPGRTPTVALLCDYYPPHVPGGAERSTQRLAQALAVRGEGVLVIAPAHGLKPGCVDEDGVLVCRLHLGPRLKGRIHPPRTMGNPWFYWRYYRRALKVLRAIRPQVIHAQNVYSSLPAVLLGRRLSLPVVVTVRDFRYICPISFCLHEQRDVDLPCDAKKFRACLRDYERAYARPRPGLLRRIWRNAQRRLEWRDTRLRRLALGEADGTVFVSRNMARHCLRTAAMGKSHRVIYNLPPDLSNESIEARELDALLEGFGLRRDRYFLFVGRFSRGKGAQTVVSASQMLDRLPADFTIAVAGDVEWLIDQADQGAIKMLGRVPPEKLDALYCGCRAVLLPSVWQEPLSRVLLEAAGHSRPVIASDVGGNPEALIHDRNGLLVPRGDPQALADAMLRLAEDAKLAQSLGEAAARDLGARFDAAGSLDGLLQYYQLLRTYHARRKDN
ncbi:MAG: glycosyltransferase [Candidatus Alcyoniella australis]|nr:glycosyltransferase [Candidatus Alcyoniella australis]